jgi:hypothetical protein
MKCTIKLKHGNLSDKLFDAKQLKIGMDVEKEHTNNPCIAKQIAKSHLHEKKNYYKLLKKYHL